MSDEKLLRIVYRSPVELKIPTRRLKSKIPQQIKRLRKSIRAFGFTMPVLVDGNGEIIAGVIRVVAAKEEGLAVIPTICRDDLTEIQIRAYRIADDKLCKTAEWDREILAAELEFLANVDIEFDVTVTGFDVSEIDILLDQVKDKRSKAEIADEANLQSLPMPAIAVSHGGDGWRLGRHFLWCNDARDPEAFKRLLGRQKAQMIFIDPPYNVAIQGHVSGLGKITHREFAMASGEMSEAEFIASLTRAFQNLVAVSADGLIAYIAMDWRHLYEALTAVRSTFTELKNLVVWSKTNAGNGSFYRSQHELFLVCKVGTAPHINTFNLGTHRYRTNVWTYPGANTMQVGRLEELALHPTVKPLALVADAIKDCSRRGGVILDCFAGSGTTIIAAEVTGRRAYAMELDPLYVDTCIRRWQAYTGEDAVHIETGLTFTEREALTGGDHVE